MAQNLCNECGCICSKCKINDHDVHLHVEIENLKQKILERDNHIVEMETNFLNEANKFPSGELAALREELLTWQDKYKRLYEAHRRVQRVNQGLEDKLLRLVDICETDKNTLTKDVKTLSHKLAEANYTIKRLTEDNERYKNDVALAIQFLQCKPGNFVSQKFDSLPNEVQAKVSTYMQSKRKTEDKKLPPDVKSIKVPIPTFPPTAMVYSIPKTPNETRNNEEEVENNSVDIVSAAIMAKVLEEREKERSLIKHCDTCTCSKAIKIITDTTHHSISTQTGEYKNSLCLRCNMSLDRSPVAMKIVKSVESKPKNVPVYVHEHVDFSQPSTNQIVAKVQPNNCLIDNMKNASSVEINKVRTENKNDFLNNKNEEVQEFAQINEMLVILDDNKINNGTQNETRVENNFISSDEITKDSDTNSLHHYLCDKSMHSFEVSSNFNSNLSEDNVCAKDSSEASDMLKGPRYCSMRLQTGSKNILLDNTHNNIAPVLYTRQNEKTLKDSNNFRIYDHSRPVSCSSEEKTNSLVSDSSFKNQRVADWIRDNMDDNVTDNLKCEPSDDNITKNDIDPERYAEMESNVKKFLFGESEFLRVVEAGKIKYLNCQESNS